MGEYAIVNGKEYKMGTCEDLYYMTLPLLRKLRSQGRIKQLRNETAPNKWDDGSYRFRFPFPDEDGLENPGQARDDKFDRSVVVNVTECPDLADLEHTHLWRSCNADRAYNVNVQVPCPQSAEFANFNHSPIDWRILGIRGQKPVNGEEWVIVECPYCHAMARLPWDDAKRLVAVIRKQADEYTRGKYALGPFLAEIANRIERGYTGKNTTETV